MTIEDDLKAACDSLRKGGVILYPTDTVWGIGCDATRREAVRRVFEIKHRADSKALITLLGDERDLWRYVDDVPDVAVDMMNLSVRPLTVVFDRGRNLAPELLGEDGSVGIRVTREMFSSRLCGMLRRPLVSTSANISGEPSPRCFSEISKEIIDAVDYVVEYRRDDTTISRPSSVVKIGDDMTVKILRP